MHEIEPARLKPGVTAEDLPRTPAPAAGAAERVIRGKALIFWDPNTPGKKRDAIDTDQITPPTDCVSESLDDPRRAVEGGVLPPPDARLPRARAPRARRSSSPATASRSAPRGR